MSRLPLWGLILLAACKAASLPAPTGLVATVADGKVSLTWNAVSGASHYEVARGTAAAGPFLRIGLPAGTSFTDGSPLPGSASFYVVTAPRGAQSAPAEADVPALAPANLAATYDTSTGRVELSWSGSAGAVGYAVLRKAAGAAYAPIGQAPTTEFVDVSPPGGAVSYAVQAVSPGGPSPLSNDAAITLPPPKPVVTATADSHSITLSWPDNGATSYEISKSSSANGPFTVVATVTSPGYTDTGLAPITAYSYQVLGISAVGRGHAASLTVLTAPLGPAGVAAAGADSLAVVSWTPLSVPPGTPKVTYQVSRGTAPGGPYTALAPAVGTAQYADFTVTGGQTYFYVVAASVGTGFGDASGEASAIASGVAVTDVVTFVGETADTAQPEDLLAFHVDAVQPDGAVWLGKGTEDGGVSAIPGVPAGSYYLRYQNPYSGYAEYVDTDQRAIDMSHYWPGRPDLTVADAGTKVAFSLQNLDAWDAGDTLEMFSFGANLGYYGLDQCTSGTLAPNATSFTGTLDWSGIGTRCGGALNDVSAADGDSLIVSQLSAVVSSNGTRYQALRKSLRQSINTKIGTTAFAGAMTPPATQTLAVKYMRSQFKQYQADVHPSADAGDSDVFYYEVLPGLATRGLYLNGTPDLAVLVPDAGTADLDFGTLTFGNPFGAADQYAEIDSDFAMTYSIPGASGVWIQHPAIGVRDLAANMSFAGLVPRISPPRTVAIQGGAGCPTGCTVTADRAGVSTTPTFSWTAPAAGTPDAYLVFIGHLHPDNAGRITASAVARLWTRPPATALQVPPGVLSAGQYYWAEVVAYVGHGESATHPLKLESEVDFAIASTSKFTP